MIRRRTWLIVLAMLALLLVADFVSPLRVRQVSISMAPEQILRLGPLNITNTLLSAWMGSLLLIVLALVVRRHLVEIPAAGSLQSLIETAFESLRNTMDSIAGRRAGAFFPVVATFFLYILASDWIGLLPGFGSVGLWQERGGQRVLVPLLRGATTDLNTTLALALCSVLSMQAYGIHYRGLGRYLLRFVAVGRLAAFFHGLLRGGRVEVGQLFRGLLDLFIGLLEILDELTKVMSFAFRLFGNMFGGEVLLLIIAFLAPFVISLPFIAMELFIGFIQAYIFAILTTAFLARATSNEIHADQDAEASAAAQDAPSTSAPGDLPAR